MRRRPRVPLRRWRVLILAFVALAIWAWDRYAAPELAEAGETAVETAFAERRSGVMVEVTGSVQRVLADDSEGDRHQRFVLELGGGHTLLVAHNIDVAPRVPLERGDTVTVRGQYEWNPRGGVLHWTHRDPDGERRDTGWIRLAGRTYS